MPRYAIDRLILMLSLTAALLFGAAWLARAPHKPPLTRVDPATVQRIQVMQDGSPRLALERGRDGRWRITRPLRAPARPRRVARLLALLRAPSERRWPVSPELLRESGLDRPRRSVLFDRTRIDFGAESTPPGLRYVRAGDRIQLIDTLWFNISGLPAAHYRAAR